MTITTNRSCVLLKPLTVEIRDVPIPSLGDDDVLVKIEATGICGSDVRARLPNYLHVRLC
jgi:threonine dehydrogenase-like Zn-dependent dehydrogenase